MPIFIIVTITIIISIFDYNEDFSIWKTEIVRNLVLIICIAITLFLFSVVYDFISIKNRWLRYVIQLVFWSLGGTVGAVLGWFATDLVIGVRITHPLLFISLVVAISVVLSAGLTAYGLLEDQLKLAAKKLSEKEINEQKLLKLKMKAELEAIKAKVNPHFPIVIFTTAYDQYALKAFEENSVDYCKLRWRVLSSIRISNS